MQCTYLAFFLNSKYWASEVHPALFMHFIDLALFLNSHCCTFEFYSAIFMQVIVLLLIINSHYRAIRLVYSLFMHSSDLARILNSHFCKLGLYSFIFMHSIDLPLILNSHYCAPEFFCFYAFYKSSSSSQQSLLHIRAPLLPYLCISQTCLSLSTGHLSFILVFLFIAQTLLSLLAVIDAHPRSNLVFYAFHRRCSYPQQSFLHVRALFCSFYAFHRPCSHSLVSLVCTLAQVRFFCSDLFMHPIDHVLTLKWHLCAS